ncbi:glycosyltransferase [Maliponia aquimaris]|uniref:GDP-mannose-dependent alpha-(1-6)-phosphatidylinositol monomannoside mannosyltransferase n=1 Tax=Maliponia aquimaris TaxID=1673631 RepID=A0A238JZ89_9RHOB|nr:glycosyltransferase [Maliponia aquimaris]SMX35960.1 GDP-mannose-dependent alpha-(1-6)-phosphatidylinositol monomannoside mannosyltransferase [Maliponia aquimaris]
MRTAIATSDYFVTGETFINRHVEHLFGGDTCILCGRHNGQDPLGKPLFVRRAPLTLADKLRAPFAALSGAVLYGTSRLPFGDNRRKLIAFLQEQRVEVILAEFGTQALVVAKLGNDLGIPVFTYWRGTDASAALRSRQRVRSYRLMMTRLAGMFSVSQFLLDTLAAHGVSHPNAHVVPSGVDIRRFTPGEKRPGSFLAVGRMVAKKAPQVTLRAFAKAAQGRDAQLTFIGDGPLLEDSRAMARQLGIAGQVTFTGALPHDQVRRHLQTTEVFLQHSVTAPDGNTEGLPTAIQEALACGCITLSTRHAGIPEAVTDGVNGLLVDEWDEDGFAERITRILDMPDRSALARAARATAEAKFDNTIGLARVEEVIRDTCARR